MVHCAGNEVKSEKMDPSKSLSKYGKRGTILGWYEIQSAFYRALPPDTVVFDSRFEPAATALVTSKMEASKYLSGALHDTVGLICGGLKMFTCRKMFKD